ncbi:hypothetical protein HZB02_05360 [Candidatus Woesearchaeota archaeon]|nr:hypothetical protein [Candidatus Woesearchaeota archaeon]
MFSPFIKKLMFARQFSIDNGVIELIGKRQVMLPSEALLYFDLIDEKKAYELAKKSGKETIEYYAKRLGGSSEGMLKIIEEIFESFGLGKMKVTKFDGIQKVVEIIIPDSTIGHVAKEKYKKTKDPACCITAGMLAGMFSFLLKKDVQCKEVTCIAMGHGGCKFEIR